MKLGLMVLSTAFLLNLASAQDSDSQGAKGDDKSRSTIVIGTEGEEASKGVQVDKGKDVQAVESKGSVGTGFVIHSGQYGGAGGQLTASYERYYFPRLKIQGKSVPTSYTGSNDYGTFRVGGAIGLVGNTTLALGNGSVSRFQLELPHLLAGRAVAVMADGGPSAEATVGVGAAGGVGKVGQQKFSYFNPVFQIDGRGLVPFSVNDTKMILELVGRLGSATGIGLKVGTDKKDKNVYLGANYEKRFDAGTSTKSVFIGGTYDKIEGRFQFQRVDLADTNQKDNRFQFIIEIPLPLSSNDNVNDGSRKGKLQEGTGTEKKVAKASSKAA